MPSRLSDTSHNGIDLIVVPELSRIHPKFVSNLTFLASSFNAECFPHSFVLIQIFFGLTQEQHKPTMASDSKIPAVPTIQVRRRKRMTPRMFCRQGR